MKTNTAKHPLEIFERGRHGLAGATEEEFQKARELLWAAPELLEACKLVLGQLDYWRGQHKAKSVGLLEAAIAKAEGGAE